MKRSTILVADDDSATLTSIKCGLAKAGYRVLTAVNGTEAVKLGVRQRPDLAVLDIRMPGVFGIEAARQLRDRANVPSLFLTAHADKELVALARQEGALGYQVKPVRTSQLIPAIETALEQAAELKRLHRNEVHLTGAIKSNRTISMAIGVYMEHYKFSESQAAEELRAFARSTRNKLVDIARKLTRPRSSRYKLIEQIRDYNEQAQNCTETEVDNWSQRRRFRHVADAPRPRPDAIK